MDTRCRTTRSDKHRKNTSLIGCKVAAQVDVLDKFCTISHLKGCNRYGGVLFPGVQFGITIKDMVVKLAIA